MCLFVAYIGLGVDVANTCHDGTDERKESGRVQHFGCSLDGDITRMPEARGWEYSNPGFIQHRRSWKSNPVFNISSNLHGHLLTINLQLSSNFRLLFGFYLHYRRPGENLPEEEKDSKMTAQTTPTMDRREHPCSL